MGNKLFVGNIDFGATEDDLRELFAECGEVEDVALINDRNTGRPRGFGFVTFVNEEDAKAAVEKFEGFEFMDRRLNVNEARPREERGPREGGGFGGRGGDRPRRDFGGGGGGGRRGFGGGGGGPRGGGDRRFGGPRRRDG